MYYTVANYYAASKRRQKMVKLRVVIAVLAVVAFPSALLAAGGMREGLWEITSSMDMPGMPMKMAPTKTKHCYTKEDVKDQKKTVTTDKNCTVTDFKTSGNKMTWKMKCTGQSAGTFSGETTFSADSYDAIMKMQSDASQGRTMTMKMKAKRIGACP
jgi:hypothetical protein